MTFSVSGSDLSIKSTGELTFVSLPDYETQSSYTTTVTVIDGSNTATQSITVTLIVLMRRQSLLPYQVLVLLRIKRRLDKSKLQILKVAI